MNPYKYGKSHYISSTQLDIGVPSIPSAYSDRSFTVVLRNTGTDDATIYLKGAKSGLLPIVVPSRNDGIVMEHVEYDMISGGMEGIASSTYTNVAVTIFSNFMVEPTIRSGEVSIPVRPESNSKPEPDFRNVEAVVVG